MFAAALRPQDQLVIFCCSRLLRLLCFFVLFDVVVFFAPAATGSRRSLDDVLRAVKASGATVYSIGLGTKVDARALQQFAELSGGRTLLPQDVSQLPAEFQRVIEDLGRRYVVGYTSTNPEHDGQWRNVEIRVTGAPQVSVRGSGGYTAPGR